LVARGGCTFRDKVLAAAQRNASAVVVYNEEQYGNLTGSMSHAGERTRARKLGEDDFWTPCKSGVASDGVWLWEVLGKLSV
jgi:hypothetical protein